jgi:hypothetical protein
MTLTYLVIGKSRYFSADLLEQWRRNKARLLVKLQNCHQLTEQELLKALAPMIKTKEDSQNKQKSIG